MFDKDVRSSWREIVRTQGCGFSFEELFSMQKQLKAMMEARYFYLEIRSWKDHTQRYSSSYTRHHDAALGLSVEALVEAYRHERLQQSKIEILTVNYYHAQEKRFTHPPLKTMLTADVSYIPKAGDQVFVRVPAFIYRKRRSVSSA